jgi:Carbohydrate-selective porin, OprB family
MWQAKRSRPIGACAVLLLLAAALASAARAQVIYNDELVYGLPGPEALYDPDQGQPQSLLPEPREVLFPSLGLPFDAERLAFRQRLYEQYGLTYALSYQQLTQYATQTVRGVPQNWAIGGWAAPGVTWTPLDRGGDYQGSLIVRPGWRGPIGNNPWPAPFGPANLGSASSAYEFTSWNSHFEIEDLFWEQRIGPQFSFRFGNQGPQTTINTFRFKDARTSFTASPLAFSETIPYPAFGAGLSFRWRPIEGNGLYVNGVLNDMNGNPSQGSLNWSHLQLGQLFAGVEVGQQWRRENGEYDQLSLLVFHAGTRSIFSPTTTPNQAGAGFKLLGEKQWGPVVGFAAYTYNTARGGGISTTFSGNTAVAGAALLRPFGIRGEVALAGMWSQPFRDIFPGSGQRDQWGIETYWNLAVTPNMTLTPGIQLIFDPSFNPRSSFIAVPDVKFRISI